MKSVAEIRALQVRTAELEAGRAEAERREADRRHEEGRTQVLLAEQGWSAAIAGIRFDPGLSRHWLGALETRRTEERALGEAAEQAAESADRQRRALQAAQARSDAAAGQAHAAARSVARRREEARLAAVEDRIGARWRPA